MAHLWCVNGTGGGVAVMLEQLRSAQLKVPADAPRYVILVGAIDPREGIWGGAVAAPAFARIATRALALSAKR